MATLGNPTGVTHQTLGMDITVDAHQHPPANRRGRLAQLPVALRQIVIDLRRRRLHGHFAQRGEVGLGEKGVDGRACLFRHVDLAVAQALQQFAGRQVDQHQIKGFLQHPVRQRFTHLHAGDAAHLVIQAFQMLDVDGGIHINAGGEQFLNILPALRVSTAGCIGVRQFVDQYQARRSLEQRVEVHFFEGHAAIISAQQGLLRQAVEQRLGFCAAVGFDHARQHLHPLAQLRVSRLEHGVGLADAWRSPEKNLQPPAPLAGQLGQQCVSSTGITHVGYHPLSDQLQLSESAAYTAHFVTAARCAVQTVTDSGSYSRPIR